MRAVEGLITWRRSLIKQQVKLSQRHQLQILILSTISSASQRMAKSGKILHQLTRLRSLKILERPSASDYLTFTTVIRSVESLEAISKHSKVSRLIYWLTTPSLYRRKKRKNRQRRARKEGVVQRARQPACKDRLIPSSKASVGHRGRAPAMVISDSKNKTVCN